MHLPNVVIPLPEKRGIVVMESDPLQGLHLAITSNALRDGKVTLGVGELASGYDAANEVAPGDDKSLSDQIVEMALTAVALDAVEHADADASRVHAHYTLSTGLPMREIRAHGPDAFAERFTGSTHEITFLQTPNHSGKRVTLTFDRALVGVEGYAAMSHLVTDETGRIKDQTLADSHVLIVDIGGCSTDCAVFSPGLRVDNRTSEGLRLGVSSYLDAIMRDVEDAHGYRFRSRAQVVQCLTHSDTARRGHINVKGNRTSINPIVTERLEPLAAEEYRQIRTLWDRQPELTVAYVIGGGGALLKPYLEAQNERGEHFPLRFLSAQESVWTIAESYYTMGQLQTAAILE